MERISQQLTSRLKELERTVWQNSASNQHAGGRVRDSRSRAARANGVRMEVKPGYKHTEVGMIPKEWDVKRLSEISPSQSVGLVINPSSYFEANGEIPMLVGSCISENKIDVDKASRISRRSNEKLSASRLKAGDLVTVRVGFPGTTAVVPNELDSCNCASMMIIRGHKSFDSHWLAELLNSRIGRKQIENVEYGTAQKQFNISDAINFLFPVPPQAEQAKIAEVANGFDQYLENIEQKNQQKRLPSSRPSCRSCSPASVDCWLRGVGDSQPRISCSNE